MRDLDFPSLHHARRGHEPPADGIPAGNVEDRLVQLVRLNCSSNAARAANMASANCSQLRLRCRCNGVKITKELILAAFLGLGLAAGSSGVNAQTIGAGARCANDYKDFWVGFGGEKSAMMSAEQLVDLSRTALKGYDACTAGDERFSAENFFQKLDKAAHFSQSASEVLREVSSLNK
jgi:hypothetical protein